MIDPQSDINRQSEDEAVSTWLHPNFIGLLDRFAAHFGVSRSEAIRAAIHQMLWQDGYVRHTRSDDDPTRPNRVFLMRWNMHDGFQAMDWPPFHIETCRLEREAKEATDGPSQHE